MTGPRQCRAPSLPEQAGVPGPVLRPAGFVVLVSTSLALHVAIRQLAPGATEHDEAEQLVLSQVLALGYGLHPPLYTWLQHGVFAILGVGVLGLSVLKHACLLAVYAFAFLTARMVLRDRSLAPLAALSLWLIPQFGWESHRDLTHSVLAAALALATLWLLHLVVRRPRAALYAGLGAAVGLGVLSKYNFLLFAVALAGGALATPAFRAAVVDRRALLTVAVAAALLLPHAVWVGTHREALEAAALERLSPVRTPAAALTGFAQLAWAVTRFLALPVLVVALCVPGVLRRGPEPNASRRLLEGYLALLLGGLALAVLGLGVTEIKGRWLQPLLAPVPLVLFLRIEAAAGPRRLRALSGAVLAFGGLWLALRAGQVWFGPSLGISTRLHLPVAGVATGLRAAGFATGTLITEDAALGGALRLHFPEARVLTPAFPTLAVPESRPGVTAVLWRPRGGTDPPVGLREFVRARLPGADLAGWRPMILVVPSAGAGQRGYRVAVALFPPRGPIRPRSEALGADAPPLGVAPRARAGPGGGERALRGTAAAEG